MKRHLTALAALASASAFAQSSVTLSGLLDTALTTASTKSATGQSVRRTVSLTQGIPQDVSKRMVKAIKDRGFKKVQAGIQGDEVRVTAPSRDELQEVIAFLKGQDFGLELKFGNYRG